MLRTRKRKRRLPQCGIFFGKGVSSILAVGCNKICPQTRLTRGGKVRLKTASGGPTAKGIVKFGVVWLLGDSRIFIPFFHKRTQAGHSKEATNTEIGLRTRTLLQLRMIHDFFTHPRGACCSDERVGMRPRRLWLSISGAMPQLGIGDWDARAALSLDISCPLSQPVAPLIFNRARSA